MKDSEGQIKNLDNAWKLQPGDLVSVSRNREALGVPCQVRVVRTATVDVDILYNFPGVVEHQFPEAEIGKEFPTVPLQCVERIFEVGDPVIITGHDLHGNSSGNSDLVLRACSRVPACLGQGAHPDEPGDRTRSMALLENIRYFLGMMGIVLEHRWNADGKRMLGIGLNGKPYDSLWVPAELVHPYRAYAEVPAPTVPPEDGPLFAASEEPEPESCFETRIDMEDPPTGAMVLARIGLSVVTLVAVRGWRNGERRSVWWDVTTGDQVLDLRPVHLKTMFLPEMVSMGEQ